MLTALDQTVEKEQKDNMKYRLDGKSSSSILYGHIPNLRKNYKLVGNNYFIRQFLPEISTETDQFIRIRNAA